MDLPPGVVPDIVERVARDRGRRLGVSPGAPAAAFVTALGALVPAGNELQMRQNDPLWKVKPTTWTAIIGDPGTNKSATLSYAVKPIQVIEAKWRHEYAAAMRAYEASRPLGLTKKKSASADAQGLVNTAPMAPRGLYVKPDAEPDSPVSPAASASKPQLRQKIANDATQEALGELLAKNSSGLLYSSDELAGWLGSMDVYRNKPGKDRPFWLTAKDGGGYTVNRRTSDTLVIENCAISVLGGIQPDKIKSLGLGMTEDGLLQRFLPIFIRRNGSGEDLMPDLELNDALDRVAVALVTSAPGRLFRFSPDAGRELGSVEAFKDREISRSDASPAMKQWLDKMPNEFGRLALIFRHIDWYSRAGASIDEPPEMLSPETAQRVRRYLTEFVYPPARVFYGRVLGNGASDEHASWIAGYVLSRTASAINAREISRAYKKLGALSARPELVSAMRVLEESGWAKVARADWKGQPTGWTINPVVHDGRFEAVAEAERTRRAEARRQIADG